MMIYLTGDIHGDFDIQKLSTGNFPEQILMSKETSYVIIAGDFGLVWGNSKSDMFWLNWLSNKTFTTLFVDGNHENHDMLDAMPVELWHGGKVHFIRSNIIHLMRGQIYIIDGLEFFTFGGGTSIDRASRKPGISWWEREMPSSTEYAEGLSNLKAHDFKVDYIITHECSDRTFDDLAWWGIVLQKHKTQLSRFFGEVEEKTNYKRWFFGHYHKDMEVGEKHTLLYRKFVKIQESEPY